MLKIELLKELLVIAIALSTVTCSFVQKTKRLFKCSNCLCHYSFLVNMLFSIFFCITFTTVDFPNSLWIGMFSFLGADTIYKTLDFLLVVLFNELYILNIVRRYKCKSLFANLAAV